VFWKPGDVVLAHRLVAGLRRDDTRVGIFCRRIGDPPRC
jgi:hypothetical protein